MRKSWVVVAAVLLGQLESGFALEPGKRLDQYVRATWTVDRGLPQSSVFGVTETRDGYLWIATQEGFVRFDGREFVTYDKNSYPQISSNMELRSAARRTARSMSGRWTVGSFARVAIGSTSSPKLKDFRATTSRRSTNRATEVYGSGRVPASLVCPAAGSRSCLWTNYRSAIRKFRTK